MKDISINYIRYFVTLINCGKFSTAAEQLHLSQPALSKSILSLEKQLGTSLLKRYHHSFELTDVGHYFYESATYFLDIYDDFLSNIESRTRSPYSGTVRISASGVILDMFFPNIIRRLAKDYPSICIFTREEDTSSSIQAILSHKSDIGTGFTHFLATIRTPLSVVIFSAQHFTLFFRKNIRWQSAIRFM